MVLRERVASAVARQLARNPDGLPNGRLPNAALDAVLDAADDVEPTLARAIRAFGLSGRARVRMLRTARTIADLEDSASVAGRHVLEAARLRNALERP